MRFASVVLLLVLAGPAFAEGNGAPAPDPDQKPYILDAPPLGGTGLKGFQAPTPVTVIVPGDPVPKVGPTPVAPAPPSREEIAPPPPKPAPKGLG